MPYLVVAVILVALLCLVNLVLTFGVIRRLRDHESPAGGPVPETSVRVGEEIGPFAATTTLGERVTADSLAARTFVGFFAPGCGPCHEKLPGFVNHVSGSTVPALAVVLGEGEEAAEMVTALEGAARVVISTREGAIGSAFRITGTPAFLTVEAGRVVATGLPQTVATA
ncbi:TlpA family protein disulfide reductase [Streptosporangium canum]|uniref:TlpA family protein disulfide reductase n=1 Tax=Streptosporangium canum TaxID=324952 RepID=UPI00368BE5D1